MIPTRTPPGQTPRLLEQLSRALEVRHRSRRTVQAYSSWVRRFILFHGKRHPSELGSEHVTAFLSSLATEGKCSASTQNQALSAILFLYRHVLATPLPWLDDVVRARRPRRLPVVLTDREVAALLSRLCGPHLLVAALQYGAGLRLMECLQLRVKDVDLERGEIIVRDGKGRKDRVTLLPERLVPRLREHLGAVHQLHQRDLARGAGHVELPTGLAAQYPRASRQWAWQWIFPATRTYRHPNGEHRRHHLHESAVPSAQSTWPSSRLASPNTPRPTHCGTPSRPACSSTATTSAPSKRFSATTTSAPP